MNKLCWNSNQNTIYFYSWKLILKSKISTAQWRPFCPGRDTLRREDLVVRHASAKWTEGLLLYSPQVTGWLALACHFIWSISLCKLTLIFRKSHKVDLFSDVFRSKRIIPMYYHITTDKYITVHVLWRPIIQWYGHKYQVMKLISTNIVYFRSPVSWDVTTSQWHQCSC